VAELSHVNRSKWSEYPSIWSRLLIEIAEFEAWRHLQPQALSTFVFIRRLLFSFSLRFPVFFCLLSFIVYYYFSFFFPFELCFLVVVWLFFFSAVSFFVPFFFLIFPFGSVLRKPRQHFLLPFGWVLFCLPSSSRPTAPFRPRTHRGPSARKNPPTNTAMIFTFYLNWVGIYRQLAYQTISSFFNKYPNHNAS